MPDVARNLELSDFELQNNIVLYSVTLAPGDSLQDATIYTPLDSSKAEFRLIKLLKPHSLHDDLQWKALSYRWGDDDPIHPIRLDGELVLVRGNLYSFLNQMQKEERFDWWFFIDALCINQDDDEEKAVQVGLMREIYLRAEEVSGWIVPEAMIRVEEYNPFLPRRANGEEEEKEVWPETKQEKVLWNSFWTRTWIVQDVLLAKRLSLRVEEEEVEWLNLLPENDHPVRKTPRGPPKKNEILRLSEAGRTPSAETHEMIALQLLAWRRFHTRSLREGHHLPFHRAVDFFALQQFSRPHDHVFGILGLTNKRMKVDYSLTSTGVFMQTLADYLLSLGFLTESQKGFGNKKEFLSKAWRLGMEQGLIAPFLAFRMYPFHPVVFLVTKENAEFFAPGKGQGLTDAACNIDWTARQIDDDVMKDILGEEPKFEVLYMCKAAVRTVKYIGGRAVAYKNRLNGVKKELNGMADRDGELRAPGDDGEVKRHSEWVEAARGVAGEMWRAFQQSGEERGGDWEGEEAWTLIG